MQRVATPVAIDAAHVAHMGIATVHEAGAAVDFTVADRYVVMVFRTEFEVLTATGMERGSPGQLFINAPGTRQCHRGVNGAGFTNDWIHLDAVLVDPWLDRLALPLNRITSVPRPDFLANAIGELQRERAANAPHAAVMVSLKVHELLFRLSRLAIMASRRLESAAEHAHYEQLCAIRLDMQLRCEVEWSVAAMARRAGLSANRFAVLYRKFFDSTPNEDLIEARMRKAVSLLTTANLQVAEVASRCGFSDANYFSRLFRARQGMSPQAFRRSA